MEFVVGSHSMEGKSHKVPADAAVDKSEEGSKSAKLGSVEESPSYATPYENTAKHDYINATMILSISMPSDDRTNNGVKEQESIHHTDHTKKIHIDKVAEA